MTLILERATKACLDGLCHGEVLRRQGDYIEVNIWRVVETERRHYWFETREAAYKWAAERNVTLVEQ